MAHITGYSVTHISEEEAEIRTPTGQFVKQICGVKAFTRALQDADLLSQGYFEAKRISTQEG